MRRFLPLLALLPTMGLAQSPIPQPPTPADFHDADAAWVALGRQLFFDPVLAGNNNIACATCHHPSLGTGDAMSLSLGEGAEGLGQARKVATGNAPKQRIPRNAPALWNLGAKEFVVMFHDGRVAVDEKSRHGIAMPDNRPLERPMPSALAAQTLLPMLSGDEMAGHPGENPVADAVADERIIGTGGAWDLIAEELRGIPGYVDQVAWLTGGEELHISHVGRALSAFIGFEFRSLESPFDRYLRGESAAMSGEQLEGMALFYGKAQCSTCHSGPFQTDHSFHAIGLPQFGPGKDDGDYGYADHGRARVTGDDVDLYRFRTPSLRNVTLTAPYGHNGAYASLEAMVRHHLDPIAALTSYDPSSAKLTEVATLAKADFQALEDSLEVLEIAAAVELTPVVLNERDIGAILAFLEALTDPNAKTGRLGVPDSVPSGLPVE